MKGQKRQTGTKGTPDANYRELCLKRERDRMKKYRETRQGAFEASLIHLDTDLDKTTGNTSAESWTNDRGKGAAEIRRFAVDQQRRYDMLSAKAIERVRRENPGLLRTLRLVLVNGNSRKKSLNALMRSKPRRSLRTAQRKYLRDLDKLLEIFENRQQIIPSPSAAE